MSVPARRFVVGQLGARMHYAVPRLLHARGLLERLYTDICAAHGLARLLRELPAERLPAALRRLAGRVPHGIDPERITCFEATGVFGVLSRMRARTATEHTTAEMRSGSRFSRLVAARGFGEATDYYGFSGESLEALEASRARGLRVTVEQIIAPRGILDRLMEVEEDRFGDWTKPEPNTAAAAFAMREKAEWAVSDRILCGSDFVRDGVIAEGGDPARCIVVPYGVATGGGRPRRRRGGPLRVLTAGALGLRKGTPYVLAAAQALRGRAAFRMVGPAPGLTPAAVERIRRTVEWPGPVPRAEMTAEFEAADVFLLPSLCEGSATVIYEALAAGLPVICTPNAGSVVTHGEDGFIVPIRDAEAIATAVDRLATDPDLLAAMTEAALRKAARHDLAAYGRRLGAALGLEGERPKDDAEATESAERRTA